MLDEADCACCIAPCVPAAAAAALLVVSGGVACLVVSVCVCLTACDGVGCRVALAYVGRCSLRSPLLTSSPVLMDTTRTTTTSQVVYLRYYRSSWPVQDTSGVCSDKCWEDLSSVTITSDSTYVNVRDVAGLYGMSMYTTVCQRVANQLGTPSRYIE